MRGNRLFRYIDRYLGIPICFVLGKISRLPTSLSFRQPKSPSSILIIKLSAMGDTILLSPVLRAIRKRYQTAKIRFLCTSINSEVIKDCPYIDEVVMFDIPRFLRNPFRAIPFLVRLRRMRFDLSFDFDQWLRTSSILSFLAGATERTGFRTSGQFRHYLYTTSITHDKKKHEVECFLDLVKAAGIETKVWPLEFWGIDHTLLYGLRKRKKFTPLLIAVHPGCGQHGFQREWPEEYYAELSDRLIEQFRATVILTGGKDEVGLVKKTASIMKRSATILAGITSLKELAGVFKGCSLVICGNTGVMHLAVAVGTPTIALHGPTDPIKWGPLGEDHVVVRCHLPCSPCLYLGFEYGCKERRCMESIQIDDVLNVVKEKIRTLVFT